MTVLHLHRTASTRQAQPPAGDSATGTPAGQPVSKLAAGLPVIGEHPAAASPRPASGSRARGRVSGRVRAIVPGLLLALAVAAVATVVGQHVPLVGSAVPGAVIGAGIALAVRPGARLAPGLKWASTFVLQCSVVLLGAQLSIGEAARVGVSSLPVMLGTLAICLGAAWLYGRLLKVPHDLRTLIGVGTGICGGSAIAAAAPVIEAASADVAYAISTIFLFNIAAVLAFPLLGHALGMSQQSFGLFAGTAVNDTSSVVATAATYGAAASSHAVVVKLVRTLMIIPICLGLAALTARKRTATTGTALPAPDTPAPSAPVTSAAARAVTTAAPVQAVPASTAAARAVTTAAPVQAAPASTAAVPLQDAPTPTAATTAPALRAARMSPRRIAKLVPWFLIGFVVAAAVNSSGVIPAGAHIPLQHVSVFLVAVALSAIGLSTDMAALRRAGHRPLLLGALLWITVAGASLGLQALTGTI